MCLAYSPWSSDDVQPDSSPGMRMSWLLRRFETLLGRVPEKEFGSLTMI